MATGTKARAATPSGSSFAADARRTAPAVRSKAAPIPDAPPPRIRRPPREPKKRKRGGKRRSGFGRIIYWGFVLALWAPDRRHRHAGLDRHPSAADPVARNSQAPARRSSSSASNGATLATRGDMGGAAVPMNELPDYVPNAFVAIEDRRFYSHHGIDPLGILRAIVRDILRRGASQGGSTLTQQLAKNLFLTQERTVSRKVQEVVLALWLEHKYTQGADSRALSQPRLFRRRRLRRRRRGATLFRQIGAAIDAAGSRDARRPRAIAVAARAEPQSRRRRAPRRDRARRHGGAENDQRRRRESGAGASGARGAAGRRRLGQLRRRLGDGRGRRSDRQVRSGHRRADHDRSGAAERGRTGLGRCAQAEGRQAQHFARRAGRHDAGRRGAGAGRRAELRREPVQPRRRRQAPARLVVQAVRLSHRARTRTDARQRARRRADRRSRAGSRKISSANMPGR